MALHINVSNITLFASRSALIATAAMGRRRRYGVGVAELMVVTNFATTPTAERGGPFADNVGVLDVHFAAGSAATSTLSAATEEDGGKAGGVGVAVSLLPATSASTSTPTVMFLETVAAMTSVADVTFETDSATTLVTDLAKG